jgi:amidase
VVPYSRQRKLSVSGVEGIKAVAGPMVTSIRDTQLFLKEIVAAAPWKYDAAVNRTVWQDLPALTPDALIIGVIEDDGVFTPHPPVRRAMHEAVAKLKKAGVKVVPVELPQIAQKYAQMFKIFQAAGEGVSSLQRWEPR